MKTSIAIAIACLFPTLLFSSCRDSTVHGAQARGLTITKPADQSIRQGESLPLTFRIVRSQSTDPVTVRVTNLPAGVKSSQAEQILAREESNATFMFNADPTASVGVQEGVKITAETAGGLTASETFALTIKAK